MGKITSILRWPLRRWDMSDAERQGLGIFAPTPPLPKGCKTFDEWRAMGMRICAGAICVGHRDGKAIFSPDQVYKPAPRGFFFDDDHDYDDDDFLDWEGWR
jgi:hypothetical protein